MGNLWKVAVAEYNRMVHKRSFLLSLIGMPLFIGAIVAIAIFTAMPKGDDRPVGYVDLAGVTRAAVTQAYAAGEAEVDLRPFESDEAARAALQSGAIQAYYLIPADYLTSRHVTLLTWGTSPSGAARVRPFRLS